MVIGALFDTMAIYSTTVAFQSDSSGFVALISYLTIVYSFLADRFIFDEEFAPLEMVAAIFILLVTICIMIYKLCNANKAKQVQQKS